MTDGNGGTTHRRTVVEDRTRSSLTTSSYQDMMAATVVKTTMAVTGMGMYRYCCDYYYRCYYCR